MIYFLASILVLTIIFAYLYKTKLITVCPICAGVVITWLIGVVGIYTGQEWANPLIVAILLGASLGALADKYGSRFGLVWKTLMVLIGLPAVYFIVQENLWFGLGLVAGLVILTLVFGKNTANHKPHNKDLFKECC
ncbi:hypothetical protein IPM19_01730 [bacterium]|nr:MAG: hypothetical protein IPM19_01730 [bacterium]